MRSATIKSLDGTSLSASEDARRSAMYGGIVGGMLDELEARMTDPQADCTVKEEYVDSIHYISVACGYASLVMGFAAASWVIYYYF